MTIGQHINLARNKKNLTLDKLAELSTVSKHTINGWIYCGSIPSIDLLIMVADVLEITLDELVGHELTNKQKASMLQKFLDDLCMTQR